MDLETTNRGRPRIHPTLSFLQKSDDFRPFFSDFIAPPTSDFIFRLFGDFGPFLPNFIFPPFSARLLFPTFYPTLFFARFPPDLFFRLSTQLYFYPVFRPTTFSDPFLPDFIFPPYVIFAQFSAHGDRLWW